MAVLNYYNAPGRRVPTSGGIKDMRGSNNGAQPMLSKASFGKPAAAKGLATGPLFKNNVPSKSYGGSRIGRGPTATIVKTGAPGRKFGPTG
jgi:hypothetical protein